MPSCDIARFHIFSKRLIEYMAPPEDESMPTVSGAKILPFFTPIPTLKNKMPRQTMMAEAYVALEPKQFGQLLDRFYLFLPEIVARHARHNTS